MLYIDLNQKREEKITYVLAKLSMFCVLIHSSAVGLALSEIGGFLEYTLRILHRLTK